MATLFLQPRRPVAISTPAAHPAPMVIIIVLSTSITALATMVPSMRLITSFILHSVHSVHIAFAMVIFRLIVVGIVASAVVLAAGLHIAIFNFLFLRLGIDFISFELGLFYVLFIDF